MNAPLVQLREVSTGYNDETVLRRVNLEVFPDDFIGVIGPNGGGKTTLIKVMLGILPLFGGQILFPGKKPRIGYLPQASQIDRSFPITVWDLVSSGIRTKNAWLPRLSQSQRDKIDNLLKESGLTELAQRPIAELSGGQFQKVFLCRALVNDPQLLILDEPNTYVDKNFEHELYRWLGELNQRMAIMLISHDIGTISPMVKSIACVNGSLHYHPSNQISEEILKVYNCPIDLIAHGPIPHRVLKHHGE